MKSLVLALLVACGSNETAPPDAARDAVGDDAPPRSWVAQSSGVGGRLLTSVAGCGNQLYAVGESGTILGSTDGSTWTAQTSTTTRALYGVWCSGSTAIAVGLSGTILHSTNNGGMWTARDGGTTTWLRGVWGASTGDVYVAGHQGTVRRSPDGITWQLVLTTFPATTNFHGVSGRIATDANLAGSDGGATVWQETNGTFLKRPLPNSPALHAIAGSSAGGLLAVGENGTILRQGIEWDAVTSGTAQLLRGVWKNGTHAYAVGDAGTILRSSDGGELWEREDSGTMQDLYGVFALGANVYAVGANGTILRRAGL